LKKSIKWLSLVAGILVLLLFIMFVINQTVQVVDLASRVSPILATVVLWGLLAVYAIIIIVPVGVFLRLPGPLQPPSSEESRDFPIYVEALKKRLCNNPHLKGRTLSDRRDVEEALTSLNDQADKVIKRTASRVFVATAISQSGRLDAILVLSALSQMVWQVAHLFYQRPSPREFVNLYANVAATAFFASELDDVDLHEQLSPILSSTFGSVALSVPGTALLVNSIVTGSGNAFLALRVGAIAKRYCGSLCRIERRSIRRAATIEAARLLGPVIVQGTGRISKAVWDVSKEKVGSKISDAAARMKKTGQRFFRKRAVHEQETSGKEGPGRTGTP
jgi:hypothetical protein